MKPIVNMLKWAFEQMDNPPVCVWSTCKMTFPPGHKCLKCNGQNVKCEAFLAVENKSKITIDKNQSFD